MRGGEPGSRWRQSLGLFLLGSPALVFSLFKILRSVIEKHEWVGHFLAWGFVLSIPSFFFGLILTRSFRRARAKSACKILRADDRPPVLYLRSFETDKQSESIRHLMLGSTQLTPEEQLVSVLNEIGPCIAVGRPGEKSPVLGASRVYVEDENWRDFVLQKMTEASLVVILAGRGPNLAWEVAEVLARVEPEKIVFLVRGGLRNYDAFIAQTQPLLAERCELPRISGLWSRFKARELLPRWVQWVLFFSSDWSPQVELVDAGFNATDHSRVRQEPMEAAFRQVLRPVAERMGVSLEAPLLPKGAWQRFKYWVLDSDVPKAVSQRSQSANLAASSATESPAARESETGRSKGG